MAGAAKRLFKSSVDFAKMSDLVPQFKNTEDAFLKLKAANDRATANVAAQSEKPPEINFEDFKKRVPASASLIDEYEKQYKALTIPYPTEPKEIIEKISRNESEWKDLVKKIKDYEATRQKRLTETVEKFAKVPPVDQMWDQDWAHFFPEITVDHRIRPVMYETPADQQPVEEYRENWANYEWKYPPEDH